MELDTPTLPNDRIHIGGNQPPEADSFEIINQLYREQRAAGGKWLTDVPEITDEEQAGFANAYIRQCRDIKKRADEALKKERAPLDQAVKDCREKWGGIIGNMPKLIEPIQARLTAYQIAEEDRRKAAAEAARKAAEEAERKAAAEEDRANEAMRRAQAGELVGSDENPLAAADYADQAAKEAEAAKAKAARLERETRVRSGGQFTVGGQKKAASLREFKSLEWDAEQQPRISTIVGWLMKNGMADAVREMVFDLASKYARNTKFATIPPGFKVKIERRSV